MEQVSDRTVFERNAAEGPRRGAAPIAGEEELAAIAGALGGLKFGTVTIIVQDGVIVQIDRMEKNRLRRGTKASNGRR